MPFCDRKEIQPVCCSDYYFACRSLMHMGGPRVAEARRLARIAVGLYPREVHKKIADAVEDNLESRKANDFDGLCRRFGLPISKYAFRQCKLRYCRTFLSVILCESREGPL